MEVMSLQKKSFIRILKLFFLFVLISLVNSCNDRNSDQNTDIDFCNIERVFITDVENKLGELIYLDDKKKYAIKHYPNTPTIDEVTFYILCEKPINLNLNDNVKFSGKSYKFNANENYTPSVGGTEFYFLNNPNIIKL